TSPELSFASVTQQMRFLPSRLRAGAVTTAATYRRCLAWASLGAVIASVVSMLQSADSPLTRPALLVMDLTPVPVAAWILEHLGSSSGGLGLIGGFAVYLGLAGLVALPLRA